MLFSCCASRLSPNILKVLESVLMVLPRLFFFFFVTSNECFSEGLNYFFHYLRMPFSSVRHKVALEKALPVQATWHNTASYLFVCVQPVPKNNASLQQRSAVTALFMNDPWDKMTTNPLRACLSLLPHIPSSNSTHNTKVSKARRKTTTKPLHFYNDIIRSLSCASDVVLVPMCLSLTCVLRSKCAYVNFATTRHGEVKPKAC